MKIEMWKDGTYSKSNFDAIVKSLITRHFPKFNALMLMSELQGTKIDNRRIVLHVEFNSRAEFKVFKKEFDDFEMREVTECK